MKYFRAQFLDLLYNLFFITCSLAFKESNLVEWINFAFLSESSKKTNCTHLHNGTKQQIIFSPIADAESEYDIGFSLTFPGSRNSVKTEFWDTEILPKVTESAKN